MKEVTLPEGWVYAKLDDVTVITLGQSPKSEFVSTENIGLPFFQGKAEFGHTFPTPVKYCSEPKKIAETDDVLLSVRAPVGATNIASEKCVIGRGLSSIRSIPQFNDKRFLFYFFRNIEPWLSNQGTGSTFKAVTGQFVKNINFLFPPLAEQKEIAQRLAQHLAQVDSIKTKLDAIPKLIATFRQSVLADAVSGKLTEEWRGSENLENWVFTDIGNIAEVKTGKTPSRKNEDYWNSKDIPWLTSSATGKDFCFEANQFVSKQAVEECKLKVFPKHSLILAMYGEGKTRGQVTELMFEATCNQACAVLLVNEKINHKYVKIRLKENYEEIRRKAVGGNQPNLNLSKVREITINLPPLEEQIQIVARVEELFGFAERIEQQVQSASERVNLLTQSILAKAFKGELTADWRADILATQPELITGDNSAEALLAKITQQMQTKPKKTQTKTKTKAKKNQ